MNNIKKIGILAYGSLIDNPGNEIQPLIVAKISCSTPFKVEYARKSRTRGFAPTLIPTENIGKEVNAVILVLDDDTKMDYAESILWRRETDNINSHKKYVEPDRLTVNTVLIKAIKDFCDIETVLYTSIGKNIDGKINPEILCDLAIESIQAEAGKNRKDGIRYLLNNKRNGIETEFSEQYEKLILSKTETKSLEEAITKMDLARK
jgi:cation transport regulator ChaC